MKKIIIFIDSYNDFDHILPFIDYIILNKRVNVVLYKTKKSNLSGCEDHLLYLKETYDLVPINYDENFSKKYLFLMSVYLKLGIFSKKAKQNSYLLPFLMIFSRLKPLVEYFTKYEIEKKQESINADIIMMDFGQELSLFGRAMVKHVQGRDVKTIGHLHGYSIYTNTDTLQKDKIVLSPIKKFISNIVNPATARLYFDRYVVGIDQKYTNFCSSQQPNFNRKEFSRILEVGIPRFAEEWIVKYRKNIVHSKDFVYGDDEKINVVLFMSHPKYNVCVDELMLTIKALSSCNAINFVYKPHTRNGLHRINFEALNGYDASSISSLELSSWADVGIVYGSSIAFQLLQDNVPLIMPTYLHLNATIFEKNDVCIVANNLNDLMNTFNCSKDEIYKMINKDNVYDFIKHYVYGEGNYKTLMSNFYNSSTNFS